MDEEKKSGELAKSVVGFLDKYSEKLFRGVQTIYKKASDETRLNWRLGYQTYLERALNRYYFAKTFLSTQEPVALYDFYVPLGVSCGKRILEQSSITSLVQINKFSIIMATGGSGKTMMMKHLFVETITKTQQVPVFVELRDINHVDFGLFDLIKKKLRDNKFDFDDEYIELAFKAGHFAIFLDGFDEVAEDKRKDLILSIEEIIEKYDQNYIFLSSRPDDSLHKWDTFNVWKVEPLGLEAACTLVEKTEADQEIKDKFVAALRNGLFKKHESFLSNPLLLSIMMITYRDSANIPHKLSTFYERAYIALFERHDAQKGAFHREKLSKLDIQEFKKVFAAFCFFSYHREQFSFMETDVYEYLKNVKTLTGIDFDAKNYLLDLIQAICLMVREGLEVTFSHRSFQEYFTAVFISQIGDEARKGKVTEKLLNRRREVLELLYELDAELVEKYVILPNIGRLFAKIQYAGGAFTNEHHKRFIPLVTDGAYFTQESFMYPEDDWFVNLFFLMREVKLFHSRNVIPHGFWDAAKKFVADRNKKEEGFVSIEEFLTDDDVFRSFNADDNSLGSKETLKQLLELKNELNEKHRKRYACEEEFFDSLIDQ